MEMDKYAPYGSLWFLKPRSQQNESLTLGCSVTGHHMFADHFGVEANTGRKSDKPPYYPLWLITAGTLFPVRLMLITPLIALIENITSKC